jgi:hypothetical protein
MTDIAAPKGQFRALPNIDWIMLPIIIPLGPPTREGVT